MKRTQIDHPSKENEGKKGNFKHDIVFNHSIKTFASFLEQFTPSNRGRETFIMQQKLSIKHYLRNSAYYSRKEGKGEEEE